MDTARALPATAGSPAFVSLRQRLHATLRLARGGRTVQAVVAGVLAAAMVPSLAVGGQTSDDDLVLELAGADDRPGSGRRVVLVSGDEEYRSEEALPQLARILATRHGMDCRVVFAIDPETKTINPDVRTNLPGLEALADADLMIIATRFRHLPAEQMEHIDRYVASGRPIIGIRTATHAFATPGDDPYARYAWNHDGSADARYGIEDWTGGFGRAILGETWIAHHGAHGREATRGRHDPAATDHPILRGIEGPDVFGPTDVYRVRLPLPAGCTPILLGEVVAGMSPDDPATEGAKNDPMMPIAWVRAMPMGDGATATRRIFTSTIGSSTDFDAAGTRRLLVNAAYWALGLEDAIPPDGTDVRVVGPFEPTDFGFGTFVPGRTPQQPPGDGRGAGDARDEGPGDGRDGEADGDASDATARDAAARDATARDADAGDAVAGDAAAIDAASPSLPLVTGDRVAVIGNEFAGTLARSGWLHAMARTTHPDTTFMLRQLPWTGDSTAFRVRETNVPRPLDWIETLDATAVLLCFGMVEALEDTPPADVARALTAYLDEIDAVDGDDGVAARVAIVGPIPHEDLGAPWPTGDDVARANERVRAVNDALRDVAAARGLPFVDLFADAAVQGEPALAPGESRTRNGIHPTERGAFVYAYRIAAGLGWLDGRDGLGGDAGADGARAPDGAAAGTVGAGARTDGADAVAAADMDEVDDAADPANAADPADPVERADLLRRFAVDAHHFFRQRFRPTNTEYVWGRRAEPFGIVNFPAELAQLDRMIAAREARLLALPNPGVRALVAALPPADGPSAWSIAPSAGAQPEDWWDPPIIEARGTETSLGSTDIADADAFVSRFDVAEGYRIECFASEETFPEVANPLAMTFDERGRLWVLCAPTYPHLLPGDSPRSELLILEDTNGDGEADRRTVFARQLMTPTGFAVAAAPPERDPAAPHTVVYVGEAPDLLVLEDLDGDDRADRRRIVASGFGMPDSHHQISAFTWTPDGALLLHEGVFTRSAVETPWGVIRTRDAAVWRFDPRTERMSIVSHANFANPWGHVHDDYGRGILADASGGANYDASLVSTPSIWPAKSRVPGAFLNRGRPTAGCELISSRHFPEDVQDTFLVNQSISFHGARWNRVERRPDRAGVIARPAGDALPRDLVSSRDLNFRPVAMELGPDGALYIVDWCNPIIGHMQYSVRDPRRDHTHGRIWRVRHAERPLLTPPDVAGASTDRLLSLLSLPERRTRALVRRRLIAGDPATVGPAVTQWLRAIDRPETPEVERLVLEGLWILMGHGNAPIAALDRTLTSVEPRTRAAGCRALRTMVRDGRLDPSAAAERLTVAAQDPDLRVRTEAILAAGDLPPAHVGAAEAVVAAAAALPVDDQAFVVLDAVLDHLTAITPPDAMPRSDEGTPSIVRTLRLERLPAAELLERPLDAETARVRLGRTDLPGDAREAALRHLVAATGLRGAGSDNDVASGAGGPGDTPGDLRDDPRAATVLARVLDEARTIAATDAIGALLLERTPRALAVERDRWLALARATDATFAADRRRQVIGTALTVRVHGATGDTAAAPAPAAASASASASADDAALLDLVRATPERTVAALARLDAGDAPPAILTELRTLVADDALAATPAVTEIARHAAAQGSDVAAWLRGLLEPASRATLDDWSDEHVRAMAAIRAYRDRPAEDWPTDLLGPRWPDPDPERLERGRTLYAELEIGCIRCHGADGRGVEGYPPLDGSPWIVGDPRRAAAIVVHGLAGPLVMPDGRRYDSAMAPLGGSFDDAEIADILTWTRQAWGNAAPPVDAATVAAARAADPPAGLWTVADLERRFPMRRDSLVRLAADSGQSPAASSGHPLLRSIALHLGPVIAAALVIALIVVVAGRASRGA